MAAEKPTKRETGHEAWDIDFAPRGRGWGEVALLAVEWIFWGAAIVLAAHLGGWL
jgi:hypothetical protein